jgi:hypothetical protein
MLRMLPERLRLRRACHAVFGGLLRVCLKSARSLPRIFTKQVLKLLKSRQKCYICGSDTTMTNSSVFVLLVTGSKIAAACVLPPIQDSTTGMSTCTRLLQRIDKGQQLSQRHSNSHLFVHRQSQFSPIVYRPYGSGFQ